MKSIHEFSKSGIKVVLTDIDGTLTQDGSIPANSYAALWKLKESGIHVLPVTGRPAGWCEMIARTWPVVGVVGENGGLYFRLSGGKMIRKFLVSESEQKSNRAKLDLVQRDVLKEVPGCAIASDQFSRMLDLAVDFAEDVAPLPEKAIDRIVQIFERHGATAKVSNIHVNGWFGTYDKLSMCKIFLKEELGISAESARECCVFTGDSPNDEPMFEYFPLACAVSNIVAFQDRLKFLPAYVASKPEGLGFCEIADRILACHRLGSVR